MVRRWPTPIKYYDLVKIELRLWDDNDDVEELTELIHRSYEALGRLGLDYVATTQSSEVTRQRMEGGVTWVAWWESKMVGTVTIYPPGKMDGCPYYLEETPAVFGQYAVEPEWQDMGIGTQLLEMAEQSAREMGATYLACDTSDQAEDLINLYEGWGFTKVGTADWRPKVNYTSVVLARQLQEVGPNSN